MDVDVKTKKQKKKTKNEKMRVEINLMIYFTLRMGHTAANECEKCTARCSRRRHQYNTDPVSIGRRQKSSRQRPTFSSVPLPFSRAALPSGQRVPPPTTTAVPFHVKTYPPPPPGGPIRRTGQRAHLLSRNFLPSP